VESCLAKEMLQDIVIGLNFLRKNSVAIESLGESNFIYQSDGKVKIVDYGKEYFST
jgi:serine/threonine protein kinase